MRVDVNGLTTHAATGGTDTTATGGAGAAVMLIHGAGMDSSAWFLQTRYLAHRGLRVLAVDLPGHGQSEGEAPSSVEEMATWLVSFLDAAGVDRAHLVGHSMGTFIALEVAKSDPERVASVALLGTAVSMGVHPELMDAAANDLPRAAALMAGWSHIPATKVAPHPTPGLSMVGGSRALVEQSRPGVLANDLAACAAYTGAVEAAGAVTCPAMVVIGEGDKMTPPKAGRALADALGANGTEPSVVTVSGAGHMMMVEQDATVRTLLHQFLHSS